MGVVLAWSGLNSKGLINSITYLHKHNLVPRTIGYYLALCTRLIYPCLNQTFWPLEGPGYYG
jgi:hypothetical protein